MRPVRLAAMHADVNFDRVGQDQKHPTIAVQAASSARTVEEANDREADNIRRAIAR